MPLIDASLGDRTFFIQLTTKTAPGTSHSYQSADRYFESSTFSIADGVAQTVSVPFVAASSFSSLPVDFRQSQFAALLPDFHPAATLRPGNVAVLGYPAHSPSALNSWGGTADLFNFVPVDPLADANLGSVSFGLFLPSPWSYVRFSSYGAAKSMLATGATVPFSQNIGMTAFEPLPGAASPIQPVLTPPRTLRINGSVAYPDLAGVGTTPTLSWSSPASVPAGIPVFYSVSIYRLGVSATGGRTRATFVASASHLTGTSLQIPAGLLTAGVQYYAGITASAGDSDVHRYAASSVTGIFTP
jgi:hypothetical protein